MHPAASAGPILRVTMAAGKFHGVISSEGPTGSCVTMMVLSPDGDARKSPDTRTASSENHRRNSAAYVTSPMASASTLPFSCETMVAIASISLDMISNARRSISARSRAGVAANAGNDVAAAFTASSRS